MAETNRTGRRKAARELREIIDGKLFRALCEPVRVDIAAYLTEAGPADVGTIAEQFPQDGSVISRHLACLHDAGIVKRAKVGRRVLFEMDGASVVDRLEKVVDRCRAVVRVCCRPDDD